MLINKDILHVNQQHSDRTAATPAQTRRHAGGHSIHSVECRSHRPTQRWRTRSFRSEGFDESQVKTFQVPGAVELTFAASQLIESEAFDAVIVLGCVIRGGTPHFDYVCQSVTQGVTALNADCDTPVIFGVLTVDSLADALERAGGSLGNKGAEAAEAAIRMVDFRLKVADL